MNPEIQFTADRDAGSVFIGDQKRVMAAPHDLFSMLSYAVASFGGEVAEVTREIGDAWGNADAVELERCLPAEPSVHRFSDACSEHFAVIGFGRTDITEADGRAVIHTLDGPPHADDVLGGWFSSVVSKFTEFPVVCERDGESSVFVVKHSQEI
jgi:hypothetical protein